MTPSDAAAPGPTETTAGRGPDVFSSHDHRRLIGYLGLFLPIVLVSLSGIRPTPQLPRWEPLTSLSAYYHTGAVGPFVGILFALALFLFTYRGYGPIDRWAGRIGGIAALCVALFPTGAPGELTEPAWWSPAYRIVHYTGGGLLFTVFAIFALHLFRKTDVPPGQPRPPDKVLRDRTFLVCGIVIVASVAWAVTSLLTGAPIFWPETVALTAFAVSWLVKGYAWRPWITTFRRVTGT